MPEESREAPGNARHGDGRAAADPARPVEAAQAAAVPPDAADDQGRPFVAAIYIFVLPLIPDFQDAVHEITRAEPRFLVIGFSLQFASWFAYSLLTRSALGEAGRRCRRGWRMFRIQMSTKALSNIVPGGNAAGSALGYRLLTLSGVEGADAGVRLSRRPDSARRRSCSTSSSGPRLLVSIPCAGSTRCT